MSNIFKPLTPRTQIMWTAKNAYVFSDDMSDAIAIAMTGGSFTITIAGTPVAITLGSFTGLPYASLTDFVTDLQGQLDAGLGPGAASVSVESDIVFIFDLSATSVEISGVSALLYNEMPFSNQDVDTTVTVDTLQCNTNQNLEILNTGQFALNTISDLCPIPVGSEKISLWIESTSNDLDLDGYSQNIAYIVSFTNGIDGVITDGYLTELASDSQELIKTRNGVTSLVDGQIFLLNLTNIRLTSVVRGKESIPVGTFRTMNVVSVDVPIGSTGMHFVGLFYQGDPGKNPFIPEVKVAYIAGA